MAAKAENVDILGVTVCAGNVSINQAVDNALMTLELSGCDAPVYKGATATYTGKKRETFSVFGKDGMGDAGLIHPKRKAEKQSAVDFILETVKANPGEVEIIELGPATNLALAFDRDPETMKQVKKYWSMGTTGFGSGNATPVAEFNVYHDAEAYKVLTESGVEITAIGLDMMTNNTLFTKTDLDALEKKGGLSEFVSKSFRALYEFNKDESGNSFADCPDGVAVACALWDGYLKKTESCHASVITNNDEAYGEVILYKKSFTYDTQVTFDNYNFYIATETESDTFKNKLFALLEE